MGKGGKNVLAGNVEKSVCRFHSIQHFAESRRSLDLAAQMAALSFSRSTSMAIRNTATWLMCSAYSLGAVSSVTASWASGMTLLRRWVVVTFRVLSRSWRMQLASSMRACSLFWARNASFKFMVFHSFALSLCPYHTGIGAVCH